MSALALCLPLASCLQVDHFTAPPSKYDNLYFAPKARAPLTPTVQQEKWRNYALLGKLPWAEDQTRFAGNRLQQIDGDQRPMQIIVTTEQSFLNGLASFGLALVAGGFGALLFIPRTTGVSAWSEG